MTIKIDSRLEARIREKAEAAGLSVSAYIERLVTTDHTGAEELESLSLEQLNSGPRVGADLRYWEEQHRKLDERRKRAGLR